MQSTSTIEVRDDVQTQLPEHLLPLPDSEWALWRSAALRGAGFPSTEVLRLTSIESAAAADQLIAAEKDARRLQQETVQALRNRFNALSDEPTEENKTLKSSLSKALKKLTRVDLTAPPVIACADDSLAAYERAYERVHIARSAYEESFKNALATLSRSIKQVAEDARFREAVTWQNRHGLRRGIDTLVRSPEGVRHAERRGCEELVAKYLQRYSVKNDTIGFFGPVGWARLDEAEESIRVKAGAEFVEERTVYFEKWGIDALIGILNTEQSLRPWMSPRLLPTIRLDGMTVNNPLTGTRKISAEQMTVLRLCDGSRTARELARHLMDSQPSIFRSEGLVFGLLQSLRDKSLIIWGFEVPYVTHPEHLLRRQLNKIDDENLRQMALAPLDELELARDRIKHAAGDSEKLDEALENFETTFSRITNEAPTRGAGKTYAARTLIYEDCRRDVDVVLGQQVLQPLAQPLSLLLSSCRWLTCEMGKIYRKAFKEVYAQFVSRTGETKVDALSFWLQVHPLVFSERDGLIASIIAGFQERWADILSLSLNESRVQYQSEELRPQVLAAFAAPNPGWSFARHHSPDVMIVAESVEAIQRGDFHFVMGELHVGMNTIAASTFFYQHPAPDELMRSQEADLPETKAIPMPLTEWLMCRTNIVLVSPADYRIELERESFVPDRSKALPLADLIVEERDGDLMVRTRDGSLSFEIIEVFGGLLSGLVVDLFKLMPSEPHTPRVTIDRLTIARETWNFAPSALSWAFEKEESDRFIAARRWAEETQLPSRLFCKVPVETKPFYVDLDSPVYVNVLARMVRRTLQSEGEKVSVKLVEMLPELDQTWLPDAAGNHYTSELRIVAVDLAQPAKQAEV